jgi:processive 1,2-diacylglycerol beta-glucosyltransferase
VSSGESVGPEEPPSGAEVVTALILSASMGAGHDGAAHAIAARLDALGHRAEVVDFLEAGPFRIGAAMRNGYEFELKHAPSAYEALYRLWYRLPWLCPAVAWLVTALARRRVSKWVRDLRADVVVSTYPLSTLCVGRLRDIGQLEVPAVNFITDFGVHPLWVHKGIDLNLAIHDSPARRAAAATGRTALACGPAVSPSFAPAALPERESSRAALGLESTERAVLVVAGSWGVGNLEDTWRALTAHGQFTPVVVCGRDTRLLEQVKALAATSRARSVVLGWTDRMPALMAACDALVENAGGLTSLEAMRAGLPVVSYRPIAGHGRDNTAAMDAAGVARLAPDATSLAETLEVLTCAGADRSGQVERAQAMFRSEPEAAIVEVALRRSRRGEPTPA